jgi:hypothetical protein
MTIVWISLLQIGSFVRVRVYDRKRNVARRVWSKMPMTNNPRNQDGGQLVLCLLKVEQCTTMTTSLVLDLFIL